MCASMAVPTRPVAPGIAHGLREDVSSKSLEELLQRGFAVIEQLFRELDTDRCGGATLTRFMLLLWCDGLPPRWFLSRSLRES